MPSAFDGSLSALSSPSPGRRIIARITSPFGAKTRNVPDFSVELDDPHKQHSPGDVVTGSVRLRVIKPIRVTHIVVCLHGFVQVYKNPGSPEERSRIGGGHSAVARAKKTGDSANNGFATLFEDEVVLCGDGRLAEGSYQFNFELEFPDRGLPSSIDFERGTVSYMVTSTMTRPTTISPTISTDRKIYFVERIDISTLLPPKARTITLEPISRRTRAKKQARQFVNQPERRQQKSDAALMGGDGTQQSNTVALSIHTDAMSAPSLAPSELSFDSALSGSDRLSRSGSQRRHSFSASEASYGNPSKSSLLNRTITATIEPLVGGCLRGDKIPIKIVITHTKHIKSLYGVIVTLYRQARVDMHPASATSPLDKGKDTKIDEYMPKSLTGLGGLSLSGAGSSHVFRKDLSQVMLPLMIDPQTLSAEIRARVCLPDEAFPTISNVPGAMISFKYYVEVVLDIQGKLNGQDRHFGNLGGYSGPPTHVLHTRDTDLERAPFNHAGTIMVDTSMVRRDKSVVSCTFEIVVGTQDSGRRKGKRKLVAVVDDRQAQHHDITNESLPQVDLQEEHSAGFDTVHADGHNPYDYGYADGSEQIYDDGYERRPDYNYESPPPPLVPLPHTQDESQMSEKERVQHAETRLLPSQPKAEDGDSEASGAAEATAPYIPEELDGFPSVTWTSTPNYTLAGVLGRSSTPGPSTLSAQTSSHGHSSSIPSYVVLEPGPSSSAADQSGDDKQELQRHLLETEASAPPAAPPDEDENAESLGTATLSPSAPTFADAEAAIDDNDDDIHASHADATRSADLPRYER